MRPCSHRRRRIPITVRALYGFVEFTSGYFLPIATTGGDAAIVRTRGHLESGLGHQTHPAAEDCMDDVADGRGRRRGKLGGDEFGLAVVAVEAVGAGTSGGEAVRTKRLLDDAEEEEEEGKGDEGGGKGKGKGKGKAKRQRSGPRWLDGSNESDEDHVIEFEDSGIHLDMDDDVVAETADHHRAASASDCSTSETSNTISMRRSTLTFSTHFFIRSLCPSTEEEVDNSLVLDHTTPPRHQLSV